MNYSNYIIKLSDNLDSKGLKKEADFSDLILKAHTEGRYKIAMKKMISLSDHLDAIGLEKESNDVDALIEKYAFLSGLKEYLIGLADSGVAEVKRKISLYVLDILGVEEDSLGAKFLANIVGGLTMSDITKIARSNDLCPDILREVIAAMQKTGLDEILSMEFIEKAEKKIEDTISTLLGFEDSGYADTTVGKFITKDTLKSMFTYYLTQDTEFTNRVSNAICEKINEIDLSKFTKDYLNPKSLGGEDSFLDEALESLPFGIGDYFD